MDVFVSHECIYYVYAENNIIVEADGLCSTPSKTFQGFCSDNALCNDTCLKEGTVEGSCHLQVGTGYLCFCFIHC